MIFRLRGQRDGKKFFCETIILHFFLFLYFFVLFKRQFFFPLDFTLVLNQSLKFGSEGGGGVDGVSNCLSQVPIFVYYPSISLSEHQWPILNKKQIQTKITNNNNIKEFLFNIENKFLFNDWEKSFFEKGLNNFKTTIDLFFLKIITTKKISIILLSIIDFTRLGRQAFNAIVNCTVTRAMARPPNPPKHFLRYILISISLNFFF